ncbi:MAG TPA: sucrose synthase [Vicinamibacterales bacterium]|nr:sucrose synthase [Vicinamibacterales bacterium]
MLEELQSLTETHRSGLYVFFQRLHGPDQPFLTAPAVAHEYARFRDTEAGATLAGTAFDTIIAHTQDVVLFDHSVYLAVRIKVGQWEFIQVHTEEMQVRGVGVADYLAVRERLTGGVAADPVLEIDLAPFERGFPRLAESRSIGRGVEFLNRYLSGRLFAPGDDGPTRLLEFLRLHQLHGQQLMLSDEIKTPDQLRRAVRRALDVLQRAPDASPWLTELRRLGFEAGWGRTPALAAEMMQMLLDVLEAPDPQQLERFLARIPMITSIAIVSPHGYFGQANVLGKPDTGGQVVYILDQVRALERAMRQSLERQGLTIEPTIVVLTRLIPEAAGTTCDVRLEPIVGTEQARILRVPFRTAQGDVVRPWISRFQIWPYLERFADDAERELLAELGGRPDFILGNYSDGNLVASLLARRLGVTQCNIAHALEKTKYPAADLKWRELDAEYHFACQFTADLIAMNTADFIIASTYQEIAGTTNGVGQYESYQAFTLPGLYRVVSGIDCFDPKFNIVSPGASPEVFFPHWETERRIATLGAELGALIDGPPDARSRGRLAEPERPLLFLISRLDQVKNVCGFVETYARSERLQALANLLIVGGWIDPDRSNDVDERRQVVRLHELFDTYGLDGRVRWLELHADKHRIGELYRLVADRRGAFVQPALYEAFGLTVVEAMSSGLPAFVTCFGGPSEIVVHGVSGFHIDPTDGDAAAGIIAAFLEQAAGDPAIWRAVADAGVSRVDARYNWTRYANRLLELSRVYGFWRYITSLDRAETRRYLEMFHALMYRPLASRVLPDG